VTALVALAAITGCRPQVDVHRQPDRPDEQFRTNHFPWVEDGLSRPFRLARHGLPQTSSECSGSPLIVGRCISDDDSAQPQTTRRMQRIAER